MPGTASAPATSEPKKEGVPRWPAQVSHCSAVLVTCRSADTLPSWAAFVNEARNPDSVSGTALSRAEIIAQSSAVAVGIRSNTCRTSCTGLAVTLRADRSSPASCSSTWRPTRSSNASLATRSPASTGSAARTEASAALASSPRRS